MIDPKKSAFPSHHVRSLTGMSLREAYAGLALHAILSRGKKTRPEDAAYDAVQAADRLIRELDEWEGLT